MPIGIEKFLLIVLNWFIKIILALFPHTKLDFNIMQTVEIPRMVLNNSTRSCVDIK